MKKVLLILFSLFLGTNSLLATNMTSEDTIKEDLKCAYKRLDVADTFIVNTDKFKCSSGLCSSSDFNKIGILNTNEYERIGGITSYLVNRQPFVSLGNNGYDVITPSEIKYQESNGTLRPTMYVKEIVKVTGRGTKNDPWKFVYPNYNVKINIVGGNINGQSNYTEILKTFDKEYVINKGPNYYMKDVSKDVKCSGKVNYNFTDNKLQLLNVESDVTCSVKYTVNKYYLALILNNATSSENNVLVNALEDKSISISPEENYAFTGANCTNGQTYEYSNKTFTVKSINQDTTCTLRYEKVRNVESNTDGEYVVPASGYYLMEALGAKGSGNGGKGAYVSAEVYLVKGQTIKYEVGTSTNGAASIGSGSHAGGGASRFKLNSEYFIISAGGGGGSNGSPGGEGNGLGGVNSSDSSKNGKNGVSGSGGSSAADATVCTRTGTCGGGCKRYETTYRRCCESYSPPHEECVNGEVECGDAFCEKLPSSQQGSCYRKCGENNGIGKKCRTVGGGCESYGTCPHESCAEYYPTYSCCTSTSTKSGDSGNGGKSVISSKLNNKTITIKQKVSGSNNGNGKIKISFVRE